MTKTKADFAPLPPEWLIDEWFPLGHKCMDTAPEGSFKTIWGCWLAVCIASGTPVFGRSVHQGPVMMVDEETPKASLEYHLQRFSKGLGLNYRDLDINIFSMEGFRFDIRPKMRELSRLIDIIKPVFIRIDSLLAMMPNTASTTENSSHFGNVIRDDLNNIVAPDRTVLIAAHSKKVIAEKSLDDVCQMEMGSIVRGHGSIVGEGCDTGYISKKISENPLPTRFCIMTKPRRLPIPGNAIKYIEMKEEQYGKGWARLEEIPYLSLPPTNLAKIMWRAIKSPDHKGSYSHKSSWIKQLCSFYSTKECRDGVLELVERKAVVEASPQEFEMNQKRGSQCDSEYLRQLEL